MGKFILNVKEDYLELTKAYQAGLNEVISCLKQNQKCGFEQLPDMCLNVVYRVFEDPMNDDEPTSYPFFDEDGNRLPVPYGDDVYLVSICYDGSDDFYDVVDVMAGESIFEPFIHSDELIIDYDKIDFLIKVLEMLIE